MFIEDKKKKRTNGGGMNRITIDHVMKMEFAGYSSITKDKRNRYAKVLERELSAAQANPNAKIGVAAILAKTQELARVPVERTWVKLYAENKKKTY